MYVLSNNIIIIVSIYHQIFVFDGVYNIPCFSHGMSYPIAGNVKNFQAPDYNRDHPIVGTLQATTEYIYITRYFI